MFECDRWRQCRHLGDGAHGSLGWLMRAFGAARVVAGGVAGRRKGPGENVGCERLHLCTLT